MEKKVKISEFYILWVLAGVVMFLWGVLHHDWLLLVAGFLWNFNEVEIVYYQGKKYE